MRDQVQTIWKSPLFSRFFKLSWRDCAGFLMRDGLTLMVGSWERGEYNHGYLKSHLVLYFIWQENDEFERMPSSGLWAVTFARFHLQDGQAPGSDISNTGNLLVLLALDLVGLLHVNIPDLKR